jgi:hypothetical protein
MELVPQSSSDFGEGRLMQSNQHLKAYSSCISSRAILCQIPIAPVSIKMNTNIASLPDHSQLAYSLRDLQSCVEGLL